MRTKGVREHLRNLVAHLARILLRPSRPGHSARSTSSQLNVGLARKDARAGSVATAMLEDAQIGIVDAASEDELCRLLPRGAATALIKDDLVNSRHRNNPLPLGCIETPTRRRVLKTPGDPVALANADQTKGKQHELVPKAKTLPVVIGDRVARMRVAPRELLVPYIVSTISGQAETRTWCGKTYSFDTPALDELAQSLLDPRRSQIVLISPLRVPYKTSETHPPQCLRDTSSPSKQI